MRRLVGLPVPATAAERTWRGKVAPQLVAVGDCLIYRGPRDAAGYGKVWIDGWGLTRAHRLSAAVHHGLDLADPYALACHRCDNPPCVNPEHLFVGTHQDNTQDARSKGRLTARDRCRRDHPWDEQNTHWWNGRRYCRTCRRENERARKARLRAAVPS